ncbi:hypothetical protein LAZ67_19001595 [Cordylochernes scorpioides]|uniref:Transposase n=1 Tax=Cordylochernes scorpioides TaxID=51811 RepID=A0ABY6LHY7_9ARAC|nr:hypothetical protein LAZ67_19001595 [Cordylochernes scorpioides]
MALVVAFGTSDPEGQECRQGVALGLYVEAGWKPLEFHAVVKENICLTAAVGITVFASLELFRGDGEGEVSDGDFFRSTTEGEGPKDSAFDLEALLNEALGKVLVGQAHQDVAIYPCEKPGKNVVGNLPLAIRDDGVIAALRPYCRVVSLTHEVVSSGGHTWTTGNREAFVLLNEGRKLHQLPAKLVIISKGESTPAYITYGVRCSKCHCQGHRTISRRLVANGLHSCRPLRRLPLTPPNRRQRLEWCRARSTWMTEWHRVVFSDESRFCLSSDSRRVRVWRRRGERSNPAAIVERPTVRQRGIMVWSAIAYDSRSPLLRIQGTMTAQRYVDDVLRPVTLPYLQGLPNALYQQDNARPHTARISQQALQDVQMLPWPPYSPDLSPIEHVWDIIGHRLHALPQPRSEDELWQMMEAMEISNVFSILAESQDDDKDDGGTPTQKKLTIAEKSAEEVSKLDSKNTFSIKQTYGDYVNQTAGKKNKPMQIGRKEWKLRRSNLLRNRIGKFLNPAKEKAGNHRPSQQKWQRLKPSQPGHHYNRGGK